MVVIDLSEGPQCRHWYTAFGPITVILLISINAVKRRRSQFSASHRRLKNIKSRNFHSPSACGVPGGHVLGALTPFISLNPSRTLWGWYYYPALYRWENWGAETVSDHYRSHCEWSLVSKVYSEPVSFQSSILTYDWSPISTRNCHKNKSNFFHALLGWTSNKSWMPEVKQTAGNWSPVVETRAWGQRCPTQPTECCSSC